MTDEAPKADEPQQKPSYGNYFELLDRTFVSAENLNANLGEHPVMAYHPELKAHYDKAAAALSDLYTQINKTMESLD